MHLLFYLVGEAEGLMYFWSNVTVLSFLLPETRVVGIEMGHGHIYAQVFEASNFISLERYNSGKIKDSPQPQECHS